MVDTVRCTAGDALGADHYERYENCTLLGKRAVAKIVMLNTHGTPEGDDTSRPSVFRLFVLVDRIVGLHEIENMGRVTPEGTLY